MSCRLPVLCTPGPRVSKAKFVGSVRYPIRAAFLDWARRQMSVSRTEAAGVDFRLCSYE